MSGTEGNRERKDRSGMAPHEEFVELCALATSGELSGEERLKLDAHLAVCPECRQAMKEFEAVVDVGVPLLASELAATKAGELTVSHDPKSGDIYIRDRAPACVSPDTVVSERLAESLLGGNELPSESHTPISARRNGDGRSRLNWSMAWLPIAAGILLTIALGVYAYRTGKGRGIETAKLTTTSAEIRVTGLEQQISDAGHERMLLKAQLHERDQLITTLERQIKEQSASLNEMKSAQVQIEQSISDSQTAKQQLAEENASLSRKLDSAQASLGKMQSVLDAARQQQSQDQVQVAGLESQIGDLTGQLRDREQTIDRQDALLGHDRDIRELMGARDLYIAEVYDVDGDGKTKKPFGRVFYTKGKSLVFYAYDLDQQAGIKTASTFQAWGQRGTDEKQALNLGVFYQDNATKKRWVLKFDNPKELAEINAVFVTVEPGRGSSKPSSKPLLFAYLNIQPNHP